METLTLNQTTRDKAGEPRGITAAGDRLYLAAFFRKGYPQGQGYLYLAKNPRNMLADNINKAAKYRTADEAHTAAAEALERYVAETGNMRDQEPCALYWLTSMAHGEGQFFAGIAGGTAQDHTPRFIPYGGQKAVNEAAEYPDHLRRGLTYALPAKAQGEGRFDPPIADSRAHRFTHWHEAYITATAYADNANKKYGLENAAAFYPVVLDFEGKRIAAPADNSVSGQFLREDIMGKTTMLEEIVRQNLTHTFGIPFNSSECADAAWTAKFAWEKEAQQ